MADIALAYGCGCDAACIGNGLLPVSQAVDMAHGLVSRLRKTELVGLAQADGRIVARDLHAPRAMPFFDNSAMDGFAVRSSDFTGNGPWVLPVVGPFAAGDAVPPVIPDDPVSVRIFTGAPVPAGFDAVVMQEYVEMKGSTAHFSLLPRGGQNVRRAGEDVRRGAILVTAGTRIEARHLGLLASNGYAAVNVMARPRVGVFSTGDELVEPGSRTSAAQLFDANRFLLMNLACAAGAKVDDLGIVRDDMAATTGFFTDHLGRYDLMISSGAVSVGGKDFVKSAFESAGGRIEFWKVAMKPGKPVMFGERSGTVFAGLPGNSFAAYVGFKLFVEGMIEQLQGRQVTQFAAALAIAGFDWVRSTGRTEFFPVRVAGTNKYGTNKLQRLGHGGSASLYPLAQADGVAFVNADVDRIEPGDELLWHRLN